MPIVSNTSPVLKAIDALRDQAGFRLAPEMVALILAEADRDP
jgi:hypothetical protein